MVRKSVSVEGNQSISMWVVIDLSLTGISITRPQFNAIMTYVLRNNDVRRVDSFLAKFKGEIRLFC